MSDVNANLVADISAAMFSPQGVVLIINTRHFDLRVPLCPGWVGEFQRIDLTSPVFALRAVWRITEKKQRRLASARGVLWHRPEFHDADLAIAAFLSLVHRTPESSTPASTGAVHV